MRGLDTMDPDIRMRDLKDGFSLVVTVRKQLFLYRNTPELLLIASLYQHTSYPIPFTPPSICRPDAIFTDLPPLFYRGKGQSTIAFYGNFLDLVPVLLLRKSAVKSLLVPEIWLVE
jgi:hypothetical protein